MGVQATVVFADLTESTAFFDALGNEKATRAVTRLTQWIGDVCVANQGRVVKKLGDGVLAVFTTASDAANAVIEIQRGHQLRLLKWPAAIRMEIKAGIASGEVVEVDGDCYGDAVNVASRLSDLSGANQIWATEAVVDQLDDALGVRFLSLGPVTLRGKLEPLSLYRVEWQETGIGGNVTMQATLGQISRRDAQSEGQIHLSYLNLSQTLSSAQMPVHLGRSAQAEFLVDDPRVSRLHARIEWRNGAFVLVDLSSFGTWVRFAGSDTDVPLRRDECLLHGHGEIALGVPFNDLSSPTVIFSLSVSHPSLY
ncbi:adenylate/guanylate cyclase domain-containing protein [Rhodoferax koreense]|uniref:Adenylate/guanylate cyclase domain-containing protein n=1 Tax=Rhodoferax koreensis TaxID=1842727 RepID=A0A1P8JWL4_9BURK|nr:adenylate/guanylate cyclase domain-containing protein [Rhodoferax koreense]APW38152.1 adenylate/guanylate cyclase domain-containing protein [Rhodoferax koreense]